MDAKQNADYVRREWLVEGPKGALWLPGRNGDEACQVYVSRYRLTPWEHDDLCVVDVRPKRQIDGSEGE